MKNSREFFSVGQKNHAKVGKDGRVFRKNSEKERYSHKKDGQMCAFFVLCLALPGKRLYNKFVYGQENFGHSFRTCMDG